MESLEYDFFFMSMDDGVQDSPALQYLNLPHKDNMFMGEQEFKYLNINPSESGLNR